MTLGVERKQRNEPGDRLVEEKERGDEGSEHNTRHKVLLGRT